MYSDEFKKRLQDIEARRLEAQKMRQLENEKKELEAQVSLYRSPDINKSS
jgi:cell division protein FtsB